MTATAELAGGRYRLEEPLGEGGMASVYRARDAELGRTVAVKLLAVHLAGDDGLRRRFVREAQLAARLSHPNVVAVFDAGEHDGRPYLVMEHVRGETLADRLAREGRLPVDDAVGLALQACAGLQHAHDLGLVHRDVKPQNLLLREDGVLKVADFGIARAAEVSRLTELGTILGTAAYLSPEQAAGEDVTAAADIYALGAVVYECLAGRPPRRFESLAELAERHREPVPPLRDLRPEVPEQVEDAVMRALARLPEYRPASAAALAQELSGGKTEAPTRVLGGAPTRVLVRPSRPRARALLVPLVALAVAGAAVALALALDDAPPPAQPPAAEPVPAGETPEERARNLAQWLRERSEQPGG